MVFGAMAAFRMMREVRLAPARWNRRSSPSSDRPRPRRSSQRELGLRLLGRLLALHAWTSRGASARNRRLPPIAGRPSEKAPAAAFQPRGLTPKRLARSATKTATSPRRTRAGSTPAGRARRPTWRWSRWRRRRRRTARRSRRRCRRPSGHRRRVPVDGRLGAEDLDQLLGVHRGDPGRRPPVAELLLDIVAGDRNAQVIGTCWSSSIPNSRASGSIARSALASSSNVIGNETSTAVMGPG